MAIADYLLLQRFIVPSITSSPCPHFARRNSARISEYFHPTQSDHILGLTPSHPLSILEGSPLMNELHDTKVRLLPSQILASQVDHNQFKTPSLPRFIASSGKPRDVTFKGKTMTELKQEFEQECEKIEQECPELARKDGWSVLHEMLTNRDEKDIKNHYDNIDTLLVFAGLYSAILTAFVVEAYKLLQRDSSDASLQVLVQISQQLASFAVNSGFANATFVPSSLPTGPFTPERSSVWLNGLWFVALILSLAVASLGLLVKQWLRECADNPGITPEEQRRIRAFRVKGLREYKVAEIAASLPLLLQTSLILFFAGLVLFIQGVHATIGWVITGFVVAWGAFLAITTVLPWFSASCPYKTPFLKPIASKLKRILNNLNTWLKDFAQYRFCRLYDTLPTILFGDDAETKASKQPSFDADVLLDAYETSGSTDVWETIMGCVDPQNPSRSLANLSSVINRIHSPSETSTTITRDAWAGLSWDQRRAFVKSLATCIRLRLIQAFEKKEGSELDDGLIDSLFQLNKHSHFLVYRFSSRMDCALKEMSSVLLRVAPSAPFARRPVANASQLFENAFSATMPGWFGKSAISYFVGTWNQAFEQLPVLDHEDEVLKQCHRVFLCAGRSTEESWQILNDEFPELSRRIASKVNSLPDPSLQSFPYSVFRWHCIFDMAMRLHKQIPGIIDNVLFEAFHTRSMKMFDLYVGLWEEGVFEQCTINGKLEGVPQMSDASAGIIDWDQVLDEYVQVEVRGVGEYTEYGDQWDYQRLRVDCKYRMEFMLNYEDNQWVSQVLRLMTSDFQL